MPGNRSAPLPLMIVTSWVSVPTSRVTVQRFSGARRVSVRSGAAPSGLAKAILGSFSGSGRIGRVRKLFAVDTVRHTGRGGGHASGQYEVLSAKRIRCPAGNRSAKALRLTYTS